MKVILDGANLKIGEIWQIVNDPETTVELAESALSAVSSGHEFLNRETGGKIIYGINTGFGPMASHIISPENTLRLQENLIRSHAVGIGKAVDSAYVLAAMVVRLNTLAKGFSGVSPELIEQLRAFINQRITPIVPEHGAVGTSGDLVQLAHIALALMGEGEVFYRGERQPTLQVLEKIGRRPHKLKTREGLALINGTSMMTGIAALLAVHASRVLSISVRCGALALELVQAFPDSFSHELQRLRPHRGQAAIADALRNLLSTSHKLRQRSSLDETHSVFNSKNSVEKIPETVQEVYSLRCIPQILGPVFDTLAKYCREIGTEMNSVTDNPIVDWPGGTFIHGGNFHGDYVATAIDQLKITIVKLTLLAERQTNFFLNAALNQSFPPFLNLKTPGLTLGLQGLQFVATSTAAQNQTLAFPHSLHSIPTNADNQDVVSMGTDAAIIAGKVMANAYTVLTVEAVALTQAMDFLGENEKFSQASQTLFDFVRGIVPKIEEDRSMAGELARLVEKIQKTGEFDMRWEM